MSEEYENNEILFVSIADSNHFDCWSTLAFYERRPVLSVYDGFDYRC